MNNIDYEYNDFRPTGFVSVKLPDDLVQRLAELCNEAQEPINHRLAGNIKKEFSIGLKEEGNEEVCRQLWEQCTGAAKKYQDRYTYPEMCKYLSKEAPLEFGQVWANFMTKGEFNPVHDHSGIWSFVIWMKIPYDVDEELTQSPGINSNYNVVSSFQFIFNDIYGAAAETLHIMKRHEGLMAFFPSSLRHTVNPFFTSDEQRVSIAGNIVYKVT